MCCVSKMMASLAMLLCTLLGSSCITGRAPPGDGKIIATTTGYCISVTPENALHPVVSCEKEKTYEFQVVDQYYRYTKVEFREKLRHNLIYALAHTSFPLAKLKNAQVNVWILAPVFSPEKTELVVVVTGVPGHHFAVSLPVDMAQWQIRDEDFIILGHNQYPTLKARKAGQVLVELQAYAHTQPGLLEKWLQDAGVSGHSSQASLMILPARAFGEQKLAADLSLHPLAPRLLKQVHYVPAGQKEGAKGRGFSFRLVEGSSALANVVKP